MKVEFVDDENALKKSAIEDVPSGTLVQYGNKVESYGYGIVLKDIDNDNPIIYDLQDNCYCDDYENYYVWREFDMNSVKFVVE